MLNPKDEKVELFQALTVEEVENRALHGLGMETGIALDMLVATGAWLAGQLHKETASRVTRALTAA